ncbi:MAG: hypothetical protein ACRD3Q_11835, partial [Terriglobales bacterium]
MKAAEAQPGTHRILEIKFLRILRLPCGFHRLGFGFAAMPRMRPSLFPNSPLKERVAMHARKVVSLGHAAVVA